MKQLGDFNNYPYKRLYAIATTYKYPIHFIEKLVSKFDCDETEMKEVYVRMLLFRIAIDFIDESTFFCIAEDMYKGITNKDTCIGYALRTVLR